MKKRNKKKIIGVTTSLLGAAFVGLSVIAKKKKGQSTYKNNIEEQNPFEGKKVEFIENLEDEENADGIRGHLNVIGDSDYESGVYDKYIKRVLDIALSFGGLIVLSPAYAIIALAIKIDDPGPVFFTQKRLGKNKEFFKLHKFRSMKMSTPKDVPTHMLENPDEYITRVGKFLRAHSLDELPQIWDIFVGNMSIIGPRPGLWNQDVLTAERDKYNANDVKPGLTGWAQINGRDELEIPEKAKLDGEYVKNQSLMLDIKCFLGTVGKIAKDESVVEGNSGKVVLEDESMIPEIAEIRENIVETDKKKILITGKGSYIGTALISYLEQYGNYVVDELDTTIENWENYDFSTYDAIYDVAGIAHIKETDENRDLYYKVNTDLAIKLAKKAKKEGVKQFIYLSSMSVYGKSEGIITKDTKPKPIDAYGKSKLMAEIELWKLVSEDFVVSIVRPPMVFGRNCKGNYQSLRKFALVSKVFPKYENGRSMIYIDNLSSSLRMIIHNGCSGVYFPQNENYFATYDMVKTIAECNGSSMSGVKMFNLPIRIIEKKNKLFQKVFGTLVYSKDMNVPNAWLAIKDNKECIIKTESETN